MSAENTMPAISIVITRYSANNSLCLTKTMQEIFWIGRNMKTNPTIVRKQYNYFLMLAECTMKTILKMNRKQTENNFLCYQTVYCKDILMLSNNS